MSEEEIIKILKEINIVDFYNTYTDSTTDFSEPRKYCDAIQGLLDLYNNEKGKNKELDRENQALYESINCDDNTMLAKLYQKEKEKNKELTDEYLIQRNLINAEFLNENYISKDKIKAKIEECEKEKNIPHEMDFKAFYRIKDLKNIEIKVLQSLLDKE